MKKNRIRPAVILLLAIHGPALPVAHAQSASDEVRHGAATGYFDLTLSPVAIPAQAGVSVPGRVLLHKRFSGGLAASSDGEMLTAYTAVKGSAGYVAIERVEGTLDGKTGTFVLQHSGAMANGAEKLSVTVVPDSGTGQLTGLAGSMTIRKINGRHQYEFVYTLPR